MRKIIKYHRYTISVFFIISFVFIFSECINKTNDSASKNNISLSQFAGAEACAKCHTNIYEDHIHSAHNLTSNPPLERFIKGSFESGRNIFAYDNTTGIVMERRKDGFYQVEYVNGIEKEAWRMDIVVGSAQLGQSFLSLRDNFLFQLPITYFKNANNWSNSTGNPDRPVFNRTITSRCLECHTTFANSTSAFGKVPEEFNSIQVIYGVSCEKCHGPGREHVNFQNQNPHDTIGKYIINPSKFTRQQKLDLCTLCHGGKLERTKPSFEFISGDKLSSYFKIDSPALTGDKIDVHGNQYGLLRLSKCFGAGKIMTCNTCHSPHANERGNIALFSQRCISCHSDSHAKLCKLNATLGQEINKNCIDCHMPEKPSNVVTVFLPHSNKPTAALIRTHYITIYPEESEKIINEIKNTQNF